MYLRKFGVLALLAVILLIVPTSCEKERVPRVDGVEETKSPAHLSEWLEQLNAILRATNQTSAEASRILAYGSIAYYEGYALSDPEMRSLVGQLVDLDELPSPNEELTYNYGIIAEATMATVLLHLLDDAPDNIKLVITSTYSDHQNDYMFLGVEQPLIDRSRSLGELIGGKLNDWIDLDGYDQLADCDITVPTGNNDWSPTPPHFGEPENLCWGSLRPFTYAAEEVATICHPGNPINVSTDTESSYYTDAQQLIDYRANLNSSQETMALFWSDGAGTYSVPGHYVSILRQLIERNTLNGAETVTACAQLCIGLADVYISSYQLKYTYFRPRPISFIDQNIENNWEPFVENPQTAEYPSARTAAAYAAAQVFINLYGDVEFTDNTHYIFGFDARYFASFTAMAEEVSWSRLYAGTNYQSTVVASEYQGRCIAQRANELFLNQ